MATANSGLKFSLFNRMRCVECATCGVRVEEVPWAYEKHHQTKTHMQLLAHWARKLSWKEVAESFQTTWPKVFQAGKYIIEWGFTCTEIALYHMLGKLPELELTH